MRSEKEKTPNGERRNYELAEAEILPGGRKKPKLSGKPTKPSWNRGLKRGDGPPFHKEIGGQVKKPRG